VPAHERYSRALTEEMCGLAEATGLSLSELIVVGGFTDFVDVVWATDGHLGADEDDCTAALVPAGSAADGGYLVQTWDMHDTAAEHVVLFDLRPDDGPAALIYSTTGCLGQIGMNEAGICVGINNLQAADGRIGVTWPHVVREVLAQASIDDALQRLLDAPLAGGHNFLLLDAEGAGYNVEALPTARHVVPLGDAVLAHTNHALGLDTLAACREKLPELQTSSEVRLQTAVAELTVGPFDVDALMAFTRHPTLCYAARPPIQMETCGAVVMRPATLDLWACWGLPSANDYELFSLARRPS
jgi:isopenicillin-N N-acyltransferase-like protein